MFNKTHFPFDFSTQPGPGYYLWQGEDRQQLTGQGIVSECWRATLGQLGEGQRACGRGGKAEKVQTLSAQNGSDLLARRESHDDR